MGAVGGELRMHTTNENKRILANLGETEQTGQTRRTGQKTGKKQEFLGKKWAKSGKIGQKNRQKRGGGNGQMKPNPGKTQQNQKFCRILVQDPPTLVRSTCGMRG